jgi:NAD(P)-dependent dehydrogenase (short-subunit alcohol dehydrogenase family)
VEQGGVGTRFNTASTKTFTIDKASLPSLTNKAILITGGSSGIGLATALPLHSLSNNIVVLDRAAPAQTPTTAPLISSSRYLLCKCDITSWKAQRAAFKATVDKFGDIDAVYVNAGIAEHKTSSSKTGLKRTGSWRSLTEGQLISACMPRTIR